MAQLNKSAQDDSEADRRKFLAACGKFAVVTPPAITMLLSTSLTSDAIAASNNFAKGNNGPGNGVDGPPPGLPPENDGQGTSPGNPGNRGGTGGRQNLP